MAAAQRCYESVSPEDAVQLYTASAFEADLGRCLLGIGDTKQALAFDTMALRCCLPLAIRPLCMSQALALTHLSGRDLEQVAAVGRDAVRTAAVLDSTIVVERLRTLQRQVQPLRSAAPHLADLDDRLTGFLIHTTRRQSSETAL